MAVRIDQKIVGYAVKPAGDGTARDASIVQMHEKVSRPETLSGTTYKIKTPLSEHALYLTINDIVLNAGTAHEARRPFEIFINSKNMDHFQWIVALTRVISAVFRKGGDCTFLVEELKAVFDPKGGYFKPGGRYMPSLVAEIGWAIEDHLRQIGLLGDPELSDGQRRLLADKRAEFAARTGEEADDGAFPASASLCPRCSVKAVVLLDGCMTCLNCGESKCG